jgi:hypothetical protein
MQTVRSTAAMIRPGKSVGHMRANPASSQVSERSLPEAIHLFRAAMAHLRYRSLLSTASPKRTNWPSMQFR